MYGHASKPGLRKNHNMNIGNKSLDGVERWNNSRKPDFPFMNKLGADRIRGMLNVIRCRILCLPVRQAKILKFN